MYRDGIYWTLVDTAGLRHTHDKVEQEGIKRSFDEAHKADIAVLVVDAARHMGEHEHTIYQQLIEQHRTKCIIAYNKSDIAQQKQHSMTPDDDIPTYYIATRTGNQIQAVEQAINEKIHTRVEKADTPFLINKRQAQLLETLEQKLTHIRDMLNQPDVQYELVSYHIKDALEHLSELTGKSISEAGMDKVFTDFCVGK